MVYIPSRLGRVAVKEQGSGWGTAETSFAAANALRCEATLPSLVREALSVDNMRGAFHAPEVTPGSKVGTTISLRFPAHGWNTSGAAISGNPTEHPEALIVKNALGSAVQDGHQTDLLSSGTASDPEFTSATDGLAGSAQLYPVNAAATVFGVGWAEEVTQGTPDAVALAEALDAAPDTSGSTTAHGSNSIYLSVDQPTPITVEWYGAHSSAILRLFDGIVTRLRLIVDPRGKLMWEADLVFGGWTLASDDSATALGDYASPKPELAAVMGANGGRLMVGGTSIAAAGSLSAEVTVEHSTVGSYSSDQGVAAFVVQNRTVTCEVQVPANNLGEAAGEDLNPTPGTDTDIVQLDLANGGGSSFSMLLPTARLMEQIPLEDMDGIVGVKRVYGAGRYASDDSAEDAPANTAFRVAYL